MNKVDKDVGVGKTSLQQIADELVEDCRASRERANPDKNYATDAVSIEADDFFGKGREVQGVDAIKGKLTWFAENYKIHSSDVRGPFLHGKDRFAVYFEMDLTDKASGERSVMTEIAVYQVADDKIVREEFFGID